MEIWNFIAKAGFGLSFLGLFILIISRDKKDPNLDFLWNLLIGSIFIATRNLESMDTLDKIFCWMFVVIILEQTANRTYKIWKHRKAYRRCLKYRISKKFSHRGAIEK